MRETRNISKNHKEQPKQFTEDGEKFICRANIFRDDDRSSRDFYDRNCCWWKEIQLTHTYEEQGEKTL